MTTQLWTNAIGSQERERDVLGHSERKVQRRHHADTFVLSFDSSALTSAHWRRSSSAFTDQSEAYAAVSRPFNARDE